MNLEVAQCVVARTSQAPIQPAGAVTDVAAMAQLVTQNNQVGNNKKKGNGEGDQNDTKKPQVWGKIQAHLCHLH